jgi:hypothetical protein
MKNLPYTDTLKSIIASYGGEAALKNPLVKSRIWEEFILRDRNATDVEMAEARNYMNGIGRSNKKSRANRKQDEHSASFTATKNAYEECLIGKNHHNTAITIIKGYRQSFWEKQHVPGIIYCDKYLLRLKADKAYAAKNLHKLQNIILDAGDFVVAAQGKGLYGPTHTKSQAHVQYRYGMLLLSKGLLDRANEELHIALKLLHEVEVQYPIYKGHKLLLHRIQAAIRWAED